MQPRRVCLTITTRGNYGKLKSVAAALAASPDFAPFLVVAGGALLERYGNIVEQVRAHYAAPIAWEIPYLVEGETPLAMVKSSAQLLQDFSTMLHQARPDIVLVLADRYECLPMAMAAAYMNIPLVHLEGGEVTGSIDESIRHAITKLAHLHLPASADAAARIVRLGEDPDAVKVVGATSLDLIAALDLHDIDFAESIQGAAGMGAVVALNRPYLLVIQHAVTTEYEAAAAQALATLQAVMALQMPTLWLVGNMDAGNNAVFGVVRRYLEQARPNWLHLFSALPLEQYAPLLKNCACLLGNSSSGIREAAFLGVPAVNIGNRQGGRERGRNLLDVDHKANAIIAAVHAQMAHGPYPQDFRFGDGKAGMRTLQALRNHSFRLQKRISY